MRCQRRLRKLEQLEPQTGLTARIRKAVLWRVHLGVAAGLGFSIPLGTCGPGLSIAHYGTLVINPDVRIGAGCRIHPGVVIGKSDTGTPVIGDRCYLGAGAKIYGGVQVGNEVVVAPNAVVNRDVPDNTVVSGVQPACCESTWSTDGAIDRSLPMFA